MRTISWICLLALSPVAVFGAEEVMRAGATNGDNLAAEFRTVVEPNDEGLGAKAWGGGVHVTTDGVFHRFILDESQKIYVGYDVRIQEGPDKTLLVLTIEPFSLDPAKLPIQDPGSWKSFPVVREPQTQTLKLLESVALDLLVRSAVPRGSGVAGSRGPTMQTVVDYITVGRDLERLRRPRPDRSEPRPFKAEDAEMELNTPTIKINGQQVFEAKGTLVVTGTTVGLYMKDRGRFLFSMLPHADLGFRRAGWVSRLAMEFEWAGDKFEIDSRRRIVPGGGTYHVYVHHDPGYRPWGAMEGQDVYVFATGPPASLLEHERR